MSESAAPSSHSVTNDVVANASSAPPPSFSSPQQTMQSSEGNNMYEETPWILEYNPPHWPLDRQIPGQRRSLVMNPAGPVNRQGPPPQYQPGSSQQRQPGAPQQYSRPQPVIGSTIPDNIKFPSGGVMAYESQKWILDTTGLQYWPSGSNIPGFVVGNGPNKPPQFIPIQTMSKTQQPPQQQHQGMHPQQSGSGMGYGNNNNNVPPRASGSGNLQQQIPRRASAGQFNPHLLEGSNLNEDAPWILEKGLPMWPSNSNFPGYKRATGGDSSKRQVGGQVVPPNNMAAMPQMGRGRGRPCGQPHPKNAAPPQGGQFGQQQVQNGASNDMNCQAQYYQGYVCPPYLQRNFRAQPTFTESALAMIDTFTSFDSTPCNQCDVPEEERPCEEPTEPVWVWMYTMLKDVINKVKELNNNGKCSETNKNNNTLSNSGGDTTRNPTSSNTSPSSTATATNGNGNKGNSLRNLPPKPTRSEVSNLPVENKESEASNLPVENKESEASNLSHSKNDLQGSNLSPSKNDLEGSNLNEDAPWKLEKELQMWPSDSNFPGAKRGSGGKGGFGGIKLPNIGNASDGSSNLHEENQWKLEREPPMWPSDRNIPGSKRENTFKSAPAPVINANVVAAEKSKTNNAVAEKSVTNNVAAENPVVAEVPKEVASEVLEEVVAEAPEEVVPEIFDMEDVHVVEFVENNEELAVDNPPVANSTGETNPETKPED